MTGLIIVAMYGLGVVVGRYLCPAADWVEGREDSRVDAERKIDAMLEHLELFKDDTNKVERDAYARGLRFARAALRGHQ